MSEQRNAAGWVQQLSGHHGNLQESPIPQTDVTPPVPGRQVDAKQDASQGEQELPSQLPEGATREAGNDQYGKVSAGTLQALQKLFFYQSDHHAEMWRKQDGSIGYSPACDKRNVPNVCNYHCRDCTNKTPTPLNDARLAQHLRGEITLGAYQLRHNDTAGWLCMDVDAKRDDDQTRSHAKKVARLLYAKLRQLGLPTYIELTGSKGYHIWLFCPEGCPAVDLKRLGEWVVCSIYEECGEFAGVEVEVFPKQASLSSPDDYGNLVKVPLGIHKRTGQRCVFVDEGLQPIQDQVSYLTAIQTVTGQQLQEVLEEWVPEPDPVQELTLSTILRGPTPLDVQRAAQALDQLAPWRCEEYETWVHVGMALSELGAAGFVLWDKWSQRSVKYDAKACAAKWESFVPGEGITLASLFHWKQEDAAAPNRPEPVPTTAPDSEEPQYMVDAPAPDNSGEVVSMLQLPWIDAGDPNLQRITDEAWRALNQAQENGPERFLFLWGGKPVRLAAKPLEGQGGHQHKHLVVEELTPDRLRNELCQVAQWYTIGRGGKQRSAKPSLELARNMLASRNIPLPNLTRIVGAPVFAPDGTLQTRPGYHPASRTYLDPWQAGDVMPVSPQPTEREVDLARGIILEELLGDFPFVADADRAHAVALLLVPFARDLISDPTPNHLIEASTPGCGKSLLSEILLLPALGHAVYLLPEAHTDEEWRKVITSALREGKPAIIIDNVKRSLDSGALAAALTARMWTDRILGVSETTSLPVRSIWVTTANNPTLSTELIRRSIRIRLDPKRDRPWLRDGFRHEPLRVWASDARGLLVWSALTLIQSWLAAGQPRPHVKPLGSYESWTTVLGGILEHVGIPGFLGNLNQFYEEADNEGALWRQFVDVWYQRFGTQEVKSSDLFSIAQEMEGFDLGRGKTDHAQKGAFGKALAKQRDRFIGDCRIVRTGKHQGAVTWQLQFTGAPDENDEAGEGREGVLPPAKEEIPISPNNRSTDGAENPHYPPNAHALSQQSKERNNLTPDQLAYLEMAEGEDGNACPPMADPEQEPVRPIQTGQPVRGIPDDYQGPAIWREGAVKHAVQVLELVGARGDVRIFRVMDDQGQKRVVSDHDLAMPKTSDGSKGADLVWI